MNVAIGEVLPLALGIAISPIPIIAAILMLLSPKAKGTSVGFLIGWILGIVVATTIFILLAGLIPEKTATSQPVVGTIEIVLGILLLLVALRQWRSRPKAGQEPTMPKWMGAIDTLTPVKGLGLGFLLSAVNPKNLLMAVAAGVAIGGASLSVGDTVVVVIVFTVIAASTVAIPVIAYLAASARMTGPLNTLRGWLLQNNAVVMAILMLVIGFVLIGKGIAAF
jgi:threonine/homoserine/homoserine lactone efflux protein